ncbi:hypothetical protein YQE_08359, partial [Dendroctonus ponderosae]
MNYTVEHFGEPIMPKLWEFSGYIQPVYHMKKFGDLSFRKVLETMATEVEVFTIGSTVWCKTFSNHEYAGEVTGYHPEIRTLVLRCPSSNGDPKLKNVVFINLTSVIKLRVKNDGNKHHDPPANVNLHRLSSRIRNQVEQKRRTLQAISANVSVEGQSLFLALSKIIQDVKWRNSDIVIYNQEVYISPPYQLENVHGNTNNKTYDYIVKVVEKHIQGRAMSSNAVVNTENSQLQSNTRPSQ